MKLTERGEWLALFVVMFVLGAVCAGIYLLLVPS